MGFEILISLAISLGMTLVLELIFALVFRIRSKKELLLVCLVNVLTNPVVVFLYYLTVSRGGSKLVLVVLEVLAVVVEAVCYKSYGEKICNPVLFAIGANAFSFFTGQGIGMLF
jgi:hypothetical protein